MEKPAQLAQKEYMAQFDIRQFLKNGAFIRLKSGKVRLWSGKIDILTQASFSNLQSESQEFPINTIVYKNFFDSEIHAVQCENSVLETDASTLRQMLQQYLEAETPTTFSGFLPPSQEAFFTSFQTIMGKIQRGEIEKAVPIVFTESPTAPLSNQLAKMIENILESHEELYPYGLWFNGAGIIGATPEVLFRTEGEKISTMALAGTSAAEDIQALKSNRKEIHEHQIVVDDINSRLKSFGWVRQEATKAVKVGSVAHLRTELSVVAHKPEILKLIHLLHPTAALGVYPKNYGIRWLQDLPYQKQRGLFGGPLLFPISQTESICLVAIRCLQWSPEGSQVGTGCGIVRESQQSSEWEELLLKRKSIFKVLGIDT